MELRIVLCLVFIASFFGLQCRKYQGPPTELPPITQEGKNTFGCKIDGKLWVPYYSCNGFSANPCGELAVNVSETNLNNDFPLSISIKASQKTKDNSFSALTIETPTNTGIFYGGNKLDSVQIKFQKPQSLSQYHNYNYYQKIEKFEITKLDLTNKIISGVFELTLYKSINDSIRITEGRFDLKFSVCKCSR